MRRDLLHVGALTAFGLTVSDWFSQRATGQSVTRPAADACILLWLDGGPSHLETFDPKPDAPVELRGPLDAIATTVPGIRLSECLPLTANRMDDLAIIRSMTSPLGEHNFASHYLLTGYKPSPALTYAGLPSLMNRFANERNSGLTSAQPGIPGSIAMGRPNAMVGPGYLPSSNAPFVIEADPSKADFRVRDLSPPGYLSDARLTRRFQFRDMLDQLDRGRDLPLSGNTANANRSEGGFEQAKSLLASRQARDAFDIQQESPKSRARYGFSSIGQGCLMARRLIEGGTKFVTVTDRGWDTHDRLYYRLKEGFTGGEVGKIPRLDQALSGLLSDLSERGMLDSTLVVVMGEFGRTPKLNPAGGRDHWPRAFSVALAGGGIRGGQVIGASDRSGESPTDHPISPSDLVRTILYKLGLDPARELVTGDGRPVQLNRDGKLISELIG